MLVILPSLKHSTTTLVEYIVTIQVITIPSMLYQLLVMVLKMDKIIGSLETHGELNGERVVSLEFAEEQTISTLKVTATGLLLLTHGQKRNGIRLQKLKRMTQIMTQLFM